MRRPNRVILSAALAIAAAQTPGAAGDSGPMGGIMYFPGGLAVDTAGNGVLEANETVVMAPSWGVVPPQFWTSQGSTSNFTGPAGAVYTNPDAVATYQFP